MLSAIARAILLGGMVCSFSLSAWSANLLKNATFNLPSKGIPLGTTVSYTGCDVAATSAAADWSMWVNSCATGSDNVSTTLVPSTLPKSTGYMLHIVTDGNQNGVYQSNTFNEPNTLTSVWVYVNSGCVAVGTGDASFTGLDDTFCVTGKWFHIANVPNGFSPATEIVIYSENLIPGAAGADFYVKSGSVVTAP